MIGIKNTLDETITVSADSDDRSTHVLNAIQAIQPIQNQDYLAVSKTKIDTIIADDSSKKHNIYWAGLSQWYCKNCNERGDIKRLFVKRIKRIKNEGWN
jgi:hypothetical protein